MCIRDSFLSDHYHVWIMISVIMSMALLGYLTSQKMKVVELPEETDNEDTINPFKFLAASFRFATKHKYINSAILGTSVFWMIGGMIQMNVVIHCVHTLGTTNSVAG